MSHLVAHEVTGNGDSMTVEVCIVTMHVLVWLAVQIFTL